jgi:hypothetical protein
MLMAFLWKPGCALAFPLIIRRKIFGAVSKPRAVPPPLIAQYPRHVVSTPFVGMEKPKELLETAIGVTV